MGLHGDGIHICPIAIVFRVSAVNAIHFTARLVWLTQKGAAHIMETYVVMLRLASPIMNMSLASLHNPEGDAGALRLKQTSIVLNDSGNERVNNQGRAKSRRTLLASQAGHLAIANGDDKDYASI